MFLIIKQKKKSDPTPREKKEIWDIEHANIQKESYYFQITLFNIHNPNSDYIFIWAKDFRLWIERPLLPLKNEKTANHWYKTW